LVARAARQRSRIQHPKWELGGPDTSHGLFLGQRGTTPLGQGDRGPDWGRKTSLGAGAQV